jgi:hypothetical protein
MVQDAPVITRNLRMISIDGVFICQQQQIMQSKTERIKTALADGDWLSALRTASRFHDRSDDTMAYKRGFDAHQRTSIGSLARTLMN